MISIVIMIRNSFLLTISHWLSIPISCIWTCSFSLARFVSRYTIVDRLFLAFSTSTMCCLSWITCSIHSRALACSIQFRFWSIFVWYLWARQNIRLLLAVHFSFHWSTTCWLMRIIIPLRNQIMLAPRFSWLWSWFLLCRTTWSSQNSWTLINYTSITTISLTILNVCGWRCPCVFNIMNILFESIGYLCLMLLSFWSMSFRFSWVLICTMSHLSISFQVGLTMNLWRLPSSFRRCYFTSLTSTIVMIWLLMSRTSLMAWHSLITTWSMIPCRTITALIFFIFIMNVLTISSWCLFDFTCC